MSKSILGLAAILLLIAAPFSMAGSRARRQADEQPTMVEGEADIAAIENDMNSDGSGDEEEGSEMKSSGEMPSLVSDEPVEPQNEGGETSDAPTVDTTTIPSDPEVSSSSSIGATLLTIIVTIHAIAF